MTGLTLKQRLAHFVFEQKCVPWRVAHEYEILMEQQAWHRQPGLYRFLRFGQLSNPVQMVTRGPKHHFFGYYDKSPWNAAGNRLLCHQSDFTDRPPEGGDAATVGMVHLDDGNRFEVIGQTRAWNFQQGAMLRWHPAAPNRRVLYNDCREGQFIAVEKDLHDGSETLHQRPFYTVSHDGRTAFSLNFSRLQDYRRGYGYAGVPDPFADQQAPANDGIYRLDLVNGSSQLLVSVEQLAATHSVPEMRDTVHWFNHIQVSPGDRRIAFMHRWRVGESGWGTRLYCIDFDGSNLHCLLDDGMVSHYDWKDDECVLVWGRSIDLGDHFLWVSRSNGVEGAFAAGELPTDGHCSFSPDRRWVLNDTYPDHYRKRALMVIRLESGKRIDLARFYDPPDIQGELRCDLHPRWRPDGRQVCVDSLHNGQRQVYLVDLPSVVLA